MQHEDDADGAMDRQQAFEITQCRSRGVARKVLHDLWASLLVTTASKILYDVGVIEALRDGLLGLGNPSRRRFRSLVPGLVVEADVLDRQRIGVETDSPPNIQSRSRLALPRNDHCTPAFSGAVLWQSSSPGFCRALNIDTAVCVTKRSRGKTPRCISSISW